MPQLQLSLCNRIRARISCLLTETSKSLNRLGVRFYQSPQQQRVAPWFRVGGDKTFRLSYDLAADSVVFDLGGYEGQWASDIFAKYCCAIHLFEPVESFAERIKARFERNPKIIVHPFGLGSETRVVKIAVNQESSSMYKPGHNYVQAQLIKASDFLQTNNIEAIDLMKINIEGGEYDLLEHLIKTDLVLQIKNIQVQFHDFAPDAESRMRNIQEDLSKTHELTYQYPFVWENWCRKKQH